MLLVKGWEGLGLRLLLLVLRHKYGAGWTAGVVVGAMLYSTIHIDCGTRGGIAGFNVPVCSVRGWVGVGDFSVVVVLC